MPTMSRTTGNLIVGLLALALTAGLVIRTSTAVFTAQTDNPDNSLAAGTIVLTDNDGDTALLTMQNIAPGEFSENCLTVTYDGSLDPEAVKVFSTSAFVTAGPNVGTLQMQDQVRITIEQASVDSSAAFGDCSTFNALASETLVNRVLLSTWDGAKTSYETGDGTWDPALGPGQSRIYRVTLELDIAAGNEFQGASLSGINVSWATRSTATPGLVP